MNTDLTKFRLKCYSENSISKRFIYTLSLHPSGKRVLIMCGVEQLLCLKKNLITIVFTNDSFKSEIWLEIQISFFFLHSL